MNFDRIMERTELVITYGGELKRARAYPTDGIFANLEDV